MRDQDSDLRNMLEPARMTGGPGADKLDAVRQRMLEITRSPARHRVRTRGAWVAVCAVVALTTVGLAGTQAGRDLIRRIFTPVETQHGLTWEDPGGGVWSQARDGEPYSKEEETALTSEFSEIYQITQAGGGRLVGILEGPSPDGAGQFTVYDIEYTLANGETTGASSNQPTERQVANMRIDEIMRLRDAGGGEVISQKPLRLGLGSYTLRFTLSDGEQVDLYAWFPPSTREEREAIFAETRALKKELRFTVLDPCRTVNNPEAGVWGTLCYTLADGRTVSFPERVPPEIVSADGTQVAIPGVDEPLEIQESGDGR